MTLHIQVFLRTRVKKITPSIFWLLFLLNGQAQDSTVIYDSIKKTADADHEWNKGRVRLITALNIAGYGGSLIILNQAWYANYPRSSFHFFNDNAEWLQVDKLGHGWAAYNSAKSSAAMWRWAGLSREKSALIGGISGTVYLTVIEILDGFSSQWGFSWGDMLTNAVGSGLFTAQELMWKEQRIQYKFSFHRNQYEEPMLHQRADDLFGSSWYERMLKDYNAQTYWVSANLKSFIKSSRLPAWLNLAVGYGADGMFGGYENKWTNEQGNDITRYDIQRKRQFYIAPDVDFTKIKTDKKWLKTIFYFLNSFKCPAPALMLDAKGKVKGYLVFF